MLNVLKQIYDLTLNTNDTHCRKNNIVIYDFIDLNYLYNIINDFFQKHFNNLKLTKNIHIGHLSQKNFSM